jgi:putative addiction module component (TIGR02574 family)
MSPKDILPAALALPTRERAELARELLRSLSEPRDEGVEAAWAEQITSRAREVADGTVKTVDWNEARERILRRLKER